MRLGTSLAEEIVACMLCGYGVPSELGLAMFARLRERGLIGGSPTAGDVATALDEPVSVRGRPTRYRFPQQKARHIAGTLARIAVDVVPDDLLRLRDYLTTLPGIGWKTASFIARNLGCDRVAVLDVHITRGCVALGVFAPTADVARQYADLERRFIALADAIGVRPSRLDAFMWSEIRRYAGVLAPRTLVEGRGYRAR